MLGVCVCRRRDGSGWRRVHKGVFAVESVVGEGLLCCGVMKWDGSRDVYRVYREYVAKNGKGWWVGGDCILISEV